MCNRGKMSLRGVRNNTLTVGFSWKLNPCCLVSSVRDIQSRQTCIHMTMFRNRGVEESRPFVRHMWLSNKCWFECTVKWGMLRLKHPFQQLFSLDDAWCMALHYRLSHTCRSPAYVSLIFRWLTVNWTTLKWEERGSDFACVNNGAWSYLRAWCLFYLRLLFSLLSRGGSKSELAQSTTAPDLQPVSKAPSHFTSSPPNCSVQTSLLLQV